MLIEHEGVRPQVAQSAYVAPNAVLCGDVRVGEDARVLFGAVLTAEGGYVEVGSRDRHGERARARSRGPYGAHVIVGPHAHLNGATRDEALATGVSVFPGATIGRGSEVRVGGVVHVNSSLPRRHRPNRLDRSRRPCRAVPAGAPR